METEPVTIINSIDELKRLSDYGHAPKYLHNNLCVFVHKAMIRAKHVEFSADFFKDLNVGNLRKLFELLPTNHACKLVVFRALVDKGHVDYSTISQFLSHADDEFVQEEMYLILDNYILPKNEILNQPVSEKK